MMGRMQKINKFTFLSMLVVGISLFAGLSGIQSDTAHAWCDDESWDISDTARPDCFNDNRRQATELQAGGKAITQSQYEDIVESCMNNGGSDAGACSNAALTCLRYSTNKNSCTNGAYTGAIADDCNAGRSDDALLCDPVAKANADHVNQMNDSFTSAQKCLTVADNPDLKRKCSETLNNIKDQCATEQGYDTTPPYGMGGSNGASIHGVDVQKYNECLRDRFTEELDTDKEMCEANGGRMIGGEDGAQAPRCADGIGEDPNANDDPELNEVPEGQIGQAIGKCGRARVNILECEARTNDPAGIFTGILRMGVIALSMVVGAAALAGLVWASLQYARASDDQSTLSDAKNRIQNIVIGLFLYGFIMAIINFLVPGGIF